MNIEEKYINLSFYVYIIDVNIEMEILILLV